MQRITAIFLLLISAFTLYAQTSLSKTEVSFPGDKKAVPLGDVQVRWTSVPNATSYRIAVKDITTNNPALNSTEITSTSYTLSSSKLTSGHNYRISISAYADRYSTSWAEREFSVMPTLSTPTVSKPEENALVSIGDLPVQWASVPNATSYRIAVKDITTNDQALNSTEITSTSYTLLSSKLTSGHKYRISISAYADGYSTGWAEREFSVMPTLSTPTVSKPEENAPVSIGDLPVLWASVPNATSYRIAVKDITTNDPALNSTEITSTSYTLLSSKLTSGHKYRISISAYADGYSTGWAEREFSVMPTLSTPTVSKPEENALVSIGDLPVKWASVPNATSYRIAVKDITTNDPALNSTEITSTSYTLLSSKLTSGHKYRISISAYADGYSTGWAEREFSVMPTLSTPTVSKPEENAPVSIGDLPVQWASVPNATSYRIAVKDITTNDPALNSTEITSTSYTLLSSKLTSGHKYRISISAYADGYSTGWAEREFSVQEQNNTTVKYGDINNDGDINSIDMAFLRQYLLSIRKDLPNMKAADLNGDNDVNAIDFAFLRKYMLGMIKEFPASKTVIKPAYDDMYYLTDLVDSYNGSVQWDEINSLALATVNFTTRKFNLKDVKDDNSSEINIYNDKIVMTENLFKQEFFTVLEGEDYLENVAASHYKNIDGTNDIIVDLNNLQKTFYYDQNKKVNNKIVVNKGQFAYDFDFGLLEGKAYLRKLVENNASNGFEIGWNNEEHSAWVSYNGLKKIYRPGDYGVAIINDRMVVDADELNYMENEQTPEIEVLPENITRNSFLVRVVYPFDGKSGNSLKIRYSNDETWLPFYEDRDMNHGIYKFDNLIAGSEIIIESQWLNSDGIPQTITKSIQMQYNKPVILAEPSGLNGIEVTAQFPYKNSPENSLYVISGTVQKKIDNINSDGYYKLNDQLTGGNEYEIQIRWVINNAQESKSVKVIAGTKFRMYKITDGTFEDFYEKNLPSGDDWVKADYTFTLYRECNGQSREFQAWQLADALKKNWVYGSTKINLYSPRIKNTVVDASELGAYKNMLGKSLFTKFHKIVLVKGNKYISITADQMDDKIPEWTYVNYELTYDPIQSNCKSDIVSLAQSYFQLINASYRYNMFDLSKYGCDGYWVPGGECFKAIKKFQKENNLPVTGILDPTTFAIIEYCGQDAKNRLSSVSVIPKSNIANSITTIEQKYEPVHMSNSNIVNDQIHLVTPAPGPAPSFPQPTPGPAAQISQEIVQNIESNFNEELNNLFDNVPSKCTYFWANSPDEPNTTGLSSEQIIYITKAAKTSIINELNDSLLASWAPQTKVTSPSSLPVNIPSRYFYSYKYELENNVQDDETMASLQKILEFSANYAYNFFVLDELDVGTSALLAIPLYGEAAFFILKAGVTYYQAECTPGLELENFPLFHRMHYLAESMYLRDAVKNEKPYLNYLVHEAGTRANWRVELEQIIAEINKQKSDAITNKQTTLFHDIRLEFLNDVYNANLMLDVNGKDEAQEFLAEKKSEFSKYEDTYLDIITKNSKHILCPPL